jgi:hypothetical protein
MALEKKKIKKTKKTKKQTGGLNNNNDNEFSKATRNRTPKEKSFLEIFKSSPLATIFRFGSNRNKQISIRNIANKTWSEQPRLKFIKEIKELLLSPEYQKYVPVFYGNQSTKKNQRRDGYNEYICRTILGSLGVISSKRRIFIINPFAEFVYRIYWFCIANNYINDINKLKKLLKKLLKLNKFNGFPEIVYLAYGIRFCIVKDDDDDGTEKVITSQESNISSCSLVSGCSLIMSAEIREENLPSEEDISELYSILGVDYILWKFYELSKNKAEYNRILKKNYKNNKLVKDNYFTNILLLFRYLDELQNLFIQSKQDNDYIEIKNQYGYYIQELYTNILKSDTLFPELKLDIYTLFPELKSNIYTLISQDLSIETLQYSILLKILEFVINQIKTNENDFGVFLPIFEKLKKKYKLSENKYFEGIFDLLLLLNNLKNQILQLKPYNENISRIEKNTYNRKKNIIQNQQITRQNIISPKLTNILSLQNSNIPQLQELYQYVKLELQESNVNLLEVSTKLIKEIITLLKSNKTQYQKFLLFLETKPIQKSTILQILQLFSKKV